MAKPTLTASQEEAINSELLNKETQKQAFLDTVALQDPVIETKQKVDDAFKALFAYYNDIIGPYDSERRAINGEFIPNPVVEADILAVGSNPPSGRLVPTPPDTDIVRIPEFDDTGYTGVDFQNELQHITDQAAIETGLQNGYPVSGTFNESTIETASELNSSSTSLDVVDSTNPINIQVGDEIVVTDGTSVAVIKVTGVTDNMGGDPPYEFTLDIDFILIPSAPIPVGSNLIDFQGFNNTERTNKTSSDPILQPLMDTLIDSLEEALNNRKDRISEQLAALSANDDPDGVSEINTATSEANDTTNFIDNYLIATDISNTGLASLSSERSDRTTFLNTRISQILNNYTNQTENYYDQRYTSANDRGNTQKGTLRELENAKSVKSDMQTLADSLQESIDSLNNILT